MKGCLRRYGIALLLLFLTFIISINVYTGVFQSSPRRISEQDVYGTKLDRIEETINKVGKFPFMIIHNSEKN